MRDRDVIDAFVVHLHDHGYPGLRVDRRPDEENRGSSDIDAIAGPFAIEHTSIDTLPHQRRDADWFMQAAGGLEQQLDQLPFLLRIVLQYDAVSKGQDWLTIRQSLKNQVLTEAPKLTDGGHVINDVPGIPFRLYVEKASNRQPGVSFGRYEPVDDTLPIRIRQQFDRKAEKLTNYHDQGNITVLLVENSDLALMNYSKMLNAIRQAYPGRTPLEIDRIWYAETAFAPDIEFRDFTPEFIVQQRL